MKALLILLVCAITYSNEIPKVLSTDSVAKTTGSTGVTTAPLQYRVEINGLVCDFCARALEKVFGREKEVKSIKVNLAAKHIVLNMKNRQPISEARVKKLVTDSGYQFVKMEELHDKP